MTKIYIQLLDEGTTTFRPTQGISYGKDIFKILPTPGYDSEDEKWEFPPGSIVFCESVNLSDGPVLLASRLCSILER